ncbi:piggyBac transposable element-derived protein 4-like [Hoplias malabaricus]|uniref:piggyBac transposable element-derived protein 4-like n=1 Tax=Hoplias malabaricus TaxID=27720 RepID=UPI0034617F46
MESEKVRYSGENEEDRESDSVLETDSEASDCSFDIKEEEDSVEIDDTLFAQDKNIKEEWCPNTATEHKQATHTSTPKRKKIKSSHSPLTPPSVTSCSLSEPLCPAPTSVPTELIESALKRISRERPCFPKRAISDDDDYEYDNNDDDDERDAWHDISKEDRKFKLPNFKPQRPPGPQLSSSTTYSPLEIFQLFMSMSVVRAIVENTNAYSKTRAHTGKWYRWTPLTVEEFYGYIGIVLFMGLTKMEEFSDYWSLKVVYNLSFPRSVMSSKRFQAITWNLHFCDLKKDEENMSKKGTPEYDPLFKIKPLYTDFLSACQTYFQPSRELIIDEKMVLSKAHTELKQHKKDKLMKYGYKLFVLTDSATGYTWNFLVYDGKSNLEIGEGLGYDSVTRLVNHPLLGKGYKLYMDSFYTSPKLLSDLYAEDMLACGTIAVNSQGFPRLKHNKMPRTAPAGMMRWTRRDELLFVRWMDNKEVTLCTTMHKAYDGDHVTRRVRDAQGEWKVKQVTIPRAVKDYYKHIRSQDLSDNTVDYYNVLLKTRKWYKTFFYSLIDIAVMNSFIMHQELAKLSGQNSLTYKVFKENLATDLGKIYKRVSLPLELSADDVCYPEFFTDDPRVGRRVCELCKQDGKKVKTPAYCLKCRVPLCLMPKRNCFLQWHQEGFHYTM